MRVNAQNAAKRYHSYQKKLRLTPQAKQAEEDKGSVPETSNITTFRFDGKY
jgi:hypothetical protein